MMEDLRKYALILRAADLLNKEKRKVTHRRLNEIVYLIKAVDESCPYKFLVISGKPQSSDLWADIDIMVEAKILEFRGRLVPGKNSKDLYKETRNFIDSKEPIISYAVKTLAKKNYGQTQAFLAAIHEVLDRPTPETKVEWMERVESSIGPGRMRTIEEEIREVAQLCV